MKGDKQTMSLMGENRPPLLNPKPKNKTGWLPCPKMGTSADTSPKRIKAASSYQKIKG